MAQHHFYSRVPAYMSLFNRMDSYDTFAYSDGLETDFIEKELSDIYDNKPSKNDATKIRKGELNPIYLSCFTKSGRLAQGCISFLPLDYTGERSSYFVHTVVPNEEETKALLENPENAVLNPAFFKTSIDEFNLTSYSSRPNDHYPVSDYAVLKVDSTEWITKFDAGMVKRLIFALLNIACGKGKPVFISMPFPKDKYSLECLKFINTLIQIFPYSIRNSFSFVTYTDEAARFSKFNIRFLSEDAQEIPAAKGITLHFGHKIWIGLSDDQVASCSGLVEFFYSLLTSDGARREFLYFMDKAVAAAPELKKLNLKTLNELTFIFEQCSGFYSEKSILPNDNRLYDYICAYEKHRNALSDEYRSIALKCLKRYPAAHQAIPKDVFGKISKIYGSEPTSSKRVVMSVILELIHTDVMRDKLFTFIKSNYDDEDSEIKDTICQDLCRVYYGGFLQVQILNFFDQVFGEMTEKSKDAVVERLLLTVRTEAVKKRIMEFFEAHYDELSAEEKEKLYSTACEMLPHCDDLTTSMANMINSHIDSESEEKRAEIGARVYSLVEANQRCKEPKLLGMLLESPGFCSKTVLCGVFDHTGNKIFERFVDIVRFAPCERKISLLDEIMNSVTDMTADKANRFADMLCRSYSEKHGEKINIYSLVELDKAVSVYEKGSDAQKAFADKILGTLIRPAYDKYLSQAFSVKLKKDGLEEIIEYAKDKKYITDSDSYSDIARYQRITDAIDSGEFTEAIKASEEITDTQIRSNAAEHLRLEYLTGKKCDASAKLTIELLVDYLKNGEINFQTPYSEFVQAMIEEAKAGSTSAEADNKTEIAREKAMNGLLSTAKLFFDAELKSDVKEKIISEGGSLGRVISAFVSGQKHGDRVISAYASSISKTDKEFSSGITSLMKTAQSANGGFFKKIFGKK